METHAFIGFMVPSVSGYAQMPNEHRVPGCPKISQHLLAYCHFPCKKLDKSNSCKVAYISQLHISPFCPCAVVDHSSWLLNGLKFMMKSHQISMKSPFHSGVSHTNSGVDGARNHVWHHPRQFRN